MGPIREGHLIGFDWDNDITLVNRCGVGRACGFGLLPCVLQAITLRCSGTDYERVMAMKSMLYDKYGCVPPHPLTSIKLVSTHIHSNQYEPSNPHTTSYRLYQQYESCWVMGLLSLYMLAYSPYVSVCLRVYDEWIWCGCFELPIKCKVRTQAVH